MSALIPTINIEIMGIVFEAPQPYCDGRPMNLGEALVLNATLIKNLRNNWSKRIATFQERVKATYGRDQLNASEEAALKSDFIHYARNYAFPTIRTSRESADPIERHAHKIAEDIVRVKLNERGKRFEDLSEIDAERHVARIMALPMVRLEAARRAQATQAALAEALEL
jgi:hypothetical protein